MLAPKIVFKREFDALIRDFLWFWTLPLSAASDWNPEVTNSLVLGYIDDTYEIMQRLPL